MRYDLAIIGGGPAGYNAAEKAASGGLKTVLFERKAIGGVCLNEGCIPTKTLLYSAKTLDNIKSADKYGILAGGSPSFDLGKIISRKNKVVRKLTAGVRAKLNFSGVEVVQGTATITGEEHEVIHVSCGDELYSVKYVLVCTGSETVIPAIPGLADIPYWTSKEALEATELPQSLAIIGGGVIGIEFASFFNSMGVKVHVIEMMPEILGAMDKETSAMIRADYAKRGVKFFLNTKVIRITDKGVQVEKDGETETIETERVLVSVGRRANIQNIGLETLPIELLRNGVKVNEYMQTSHPRIYAAGDITGFSLLAHTAIREGEVAISHILGENDPMSYRAIPGVVYTNPEIAGVGKTEEELTSEGMPYRVLKLPMAYSGRFVAENETGSGLCKIIIDSEDRIIGCHLLGNPASELIVLAAVAIDNGSTVEEFRKHVYPHPTVAEIIRETLFS
ncbi:MAG: dihydrolipoyl dehydrogenase [Massilibacteroides sp.]|nr:dihydrolipoyl dehydrogenase [Massilibacteroides sp.]MDD3061206.1 dihydrolipoyl dehydrogenase [Massilibacteroides sp.]MDD4115575.1 dihydrolipoyl dehydrogenase [Massilibacteroides sp.]MDD4661100.1 dihydrolipoyl dehydrogenase [Massilibacteroides sp.]